MVSVTVAYVLWFFGGILGLHHIYLNRPRQCFIWFVTWGGMVLGWLSEVTRIQEYVDEANETAEFKERIKVFRKHCPKPGFSLMLLGSQLMIGHQLGKLFICALPEYYTVEAAYAPYLSHLLAALGASIGVYLASNIGPQKAPFLLPFLASTATVPSAFVLYNRRNVYTVVCVLAASLVSGQYSSWTRKPRPRNLIGHLKVCGVLFLAVTSYGALWTSNIYHNTKVNTLNGTQIPLRDAVVNFMKTQPLEEAREVMMDIIPCLKLYSLDSCQHQIFSRLAELADPDRDAWAFSVLGFDKYPSQKEIVSRCRKMSSKWHPDRFTKKNETEKAEAEKRFMDIQKACGMMDKIKQNRERKNTWSTSASEQSETIITDNGDVNTNTDDVNTETIDEDNNFEYEYTEDDDDCTNYDHDNDQNGDEKDEDNTNNFCDSNGENCDN